MGATKVNLKLFNRGSEGELIISGSIDATNAADVQKILEQQADRFDRIVLDLKDLDYISSAGLRALKVMQVKMRKKNGDVLIRNVREDVMSVFQVTGFYRLFKFE